MTVLVTCVELTSRHVTREHLTWSQVRGSLIAFADVAVGELLLMERALPRPLVRKTDPKRLGAYKRKKAGA